MKSAVKTETKAIEIIRKELAFNGLDLEDGVLEDAETICNGQNCKAISWTDTLGNCDKRIIVAISEVFGDDEAFAGDVLEII